MSSELAGWLRRQRQNRGWPIAEMARQLRRAAADSGDHTMPGGNAMCRNIRRWENGNGGISERHKLHYCRALGIPPGEFGPSPPPPAVSHPHVAAALPMAMPVAGVGVAGQLVPHLAPEAVIPAAQTPAQFAYRWTQVPYPGEPTVEREVLMAAHEGSHHAEGAERRDIGEATLEQLRADVIRLSREYMTAEPLPLFLEMRRVRSRMHAALDRRLWPRDTSELYFLLSCLNCLMAIAANGLGYPQAAGELVRAAWAYAVVIDHRPLMGKLRMEAADQAYWQNRPREARDLAANGLQYLSEGQNAALLHLTYSRAAARLGDANAARRAIADADEAIEREYDDDVLEIGGEFNLSRASHRYYAGSGLIDLPGAEVDAARELEGAVAAYAAGPALREDQSHYCELLASIDLTVALLRSGQLDAASLAMEPVFNLPPANRIVLITQRLAVMRAELARASYQGSPLAEGMDERIEDFMRETIATEMESLTGGAG